ncbi:transmembrane O-methyltransferase homolog [Spea bombifrons]|uniref:transmembrane O-methyltransferase homolog n=1 Tax=Spea bombifrons TaxID=233779 RepID=UPI00234B11CB|nr:transmembrane O-methyltransferase homolog [Spea bombifrons]
MIDSFVPSSSSVLLTGVMVPLCMTVAWVVYKYRSWKVKEMIVNLKTQQALRRYVLLESVHGKPDSVLLTYKEYSRQDHRIKGLIFTPEQDIFFADAVKKATPLTALALGTQCGYSAIRLLSLLPPNGQLYAVEQDENMAESAEEMILVSGFKNPQFKLLAQHPVDAIHTMKKQFGMEKVDLVLMDLQPDHYPQCLQALEEDRVLHPGMLLLANNMEESGAKEFLDHLQSNPSYRILSSCQGLMMVHCVETR